VTYAVGPFFVMTLPVSAVLADDSEPVFVQFHPVIEPSAGRTFPAPGVVLAVIVFAQVFEVLRCQLYGNFSFSNGPPIGHANGPPTGP
jgi:hypothetical protein